MRRIDEFTVIFMITNNCNCQCSFCSRKNQRFYNEESPITQHKRAIELIANNFNVTKFIISGGEPTLYPQILDITSFACSIFPKVEIQTNGTFSETIANSLIPLLQKNLQLQFSLDGTEKRHDAIRGTGVYKKVIKNIKFLSEYSHKLSIASTVTSDNKNDILCLASNLNQYTFKRLTVSIVQPLNPLNDILIIAPEWNRFVDDLIPRCRFRVDVAKLFDFKIMDRFLKTGKSWVGVHNCGRGINHIYISPKFDVIPCICTNYTLGNLFEDNIEHIKLRFQEMSAVNMENSPICANCQYLPICNGGCPGLSKKVFGIEGVGDIRCPKVYNYAKYIHLLE